MVTCASGEACKVKEEPLKENLVCSDCQQGVHEECCVALATTNNDDDRVLCLVCLDKQQQDKDANATKRTSLLLDEEESLPSAKRVKTDDNIKAQPEDDFTPIPVETNRPVVAAATMTNAEDQEPIPLEASHHHHHHDHHQQNNNAEPIPMTTQATAAAAEETTTSQRDITIKQEQFPVPLLDIEHFSNFPQPKVAGTKRFLDEPHPTLQSPISPFREGKGSFSTGWWLAFHHYNRELPQYADIRKDIICCNLCGAQVKRGIRARATSALVQHLKTKIHRQVFDHLTVLWEGKAHDPLLPRATTTTTNATKPVTTASSRKTMAAATNKDTTSTTMVRNKKSEERAHQQRIRAMTRWIAETNQSMNIVETESFQQLLRVWQDTARFETKATVQHVADEMMALNAELKTKNRQALAGRIVWTTLGYGGTESSSRGYRYLTAHFITNSFEISGLMLEAKEPVTDHNPHTLASQYLEDIESWGMKPGLTYVLAQDDQASNPGFVSSPEPTSSVLGAQMEKNKNLLNVHFMDQKLGSTAQVALDFKFADNDTTTVPETRRVMVKARELLSIFQQGNQRLADLKMIQVGLPGEYKGQEPLGLVEDTAEFWWTTYQMIERLVKLRPALEKLWQDDRELDATKMLDGVEWDILKQLLIVLKPLIMGVSALEHETVNAPLALVALNMIRGELAKIHSLGDGGYEDADHDALMFAPTVSKCAAALLDHFDKTWGSLEEPFQGNKIRAGARNRQKGLHWSILMAYVLDPRFKALPHIPNEKNKEAIWDAVLKELIQAKKQFMKLGEAEDPSGTTHAEGTRDGDLPKENAMMMYMMNRASPGGRQSGTNGSTDELRDRCTIEINEYKAEESPPLYDVHSSAATNPLDWWRANHARFPNLWALARVFLAIPVSAACLEKKFRKASLKNDIGDPTNEMAQERMNIRCNGISAEPSPSATSEGDVVMV